MENTNKPTKFLTKKLIRCASNHIVLPSFLGLNAVGEASNVWCVKCNAKLWSCKILNYLLQSLDKMLSATSRKKIQSYTTITSFKRSCLCLSVCFFLLS